MKTTTVPFDLLAWCRRMSATGEPISAGEAAEMLGVSKAGYYSIEARNRKTGRAQATLVKLAEALEREKKQ